MLSKRYTKKKNTSSIVYAFLFDWPPSTLNLFAPSVTESTKIYFLGHKGGTLTLPYKSRGEQGVTINVPVIPFDKLPNTWVWTLKITNVAN